MRGMNMLLGLAVGAVVAGAPQVRASSATFDFDNLLDPNYVNVIGTSPLFQNLPDAPLQNVTATGGFLTQLPVLGLGVGVNGLIDPTQSVNFQFSQAVNVDSVSFTAFLNLAGGNLGDNATFQFTAADNTVTTVTPTIISFDPISDLYTLKGTAATDGKGIVSFSVGTHDITDQFGIGSLTVDYVTPSGGSGQPLVATPLPAAATSGVGMLVLLGLAALARRRRATAG